MALAIKRWKDFDAPGLRADWDRLSASTPQASLFSSYDWCRCWARTVGRNTEVCLLCFEDAPGQVVGLLPACLQRVGGARWLKFLGRDRVSGDHLDFLCPPERQSECLAALLGFLDELAGYHGVLLGELERDCLTYTRLRAWAAHHNYPVHEREQRVVPYIDLPTTLDEYLATLSANMRYHVRRRRREFQRTDGARLRVLTEAAEISPALEDLFALHGERWQRDGQPGVFHDTDKCQFLRDFCRDTAARGWVRCYVLDVNSRPEAVLLAFHWQGTASFYQMGWRPGCTVRSPGVVLLAASIEQAIHEGLRKYDFLRGDEEYKRRWTSQAVDQVTLVIAARTPARALLVAEQAKNRLRTVVQHALGPGTWDALRRSLGGWLP